MERSTQYKIVQILQDLSEVPPEWAIQFMTNCTEREAYDIHAVATSTAYDQLSRIYKDPELAKTLATVLLEALHQGLDGWSDSDRMVIELFLVDILIAVRAS